MEFRLIITTLVGAMIFPMMVELAWGKMVDAWGPIGGFMAAAFIVGTTWALNHGFGLVHQAGDAWVDMGLAVGVGVFVSSTLRGGNAAKGSKTALYAIIGAALGAVVLSLT